MTSTFARVDASIRMGILRVQTETRSDVDLSTKATRFAWQKLSTYLQYLLSDRLESSVSLCGSLETVEYAM
jgi:hypothetical protein